MSRLLCCIKIHNSSHCTSIAFVFLKKAYNALSYRYGSKLLHESMLRDFALPRAMRLGPHAPEVNLKMLLEYNFSLCLPKSALKHFQSLRSRFAIASRPGCCPMSTSSSAGGSFDYYDCSPTSVNFDGFTGDEYALFSWISDGIMVRAHAGVSSFHQTSDTLDSRMHS